MDMTRREYNHQYYLKNKELILTQKKQYRENNYEYVHTLELENAKQRKLNLTEEQKLKAKNKKLSTTRSTGK